MGVLDGTVAVVAGGTGSVGEGIVYALLSNGADVVVPCRSEQKRERLEDYVKAVAADRLHLYPALVGDPQSVEEFRRAVEENFTRVDLAVASLGGWYYGHSLHRMSFEDWNRVMHDHLTTHFLFLRAFVSLFHDRQNQSGTYVMVNGGESKLPAPDAGVVSIAAAAQKMMSKVLAEESSGTGIKSYSISIMNPLKTRNRQGNVLDEWVSAEQLGEYVAQLYAGNTPRGDQVSHVLHTVRDLSYSRTATRTRSTAGS